MADERPWLFNPGQSGNPAGKPRGSRNKLAEAALRELCADFEGNGMTAIVRCREERPDIYLRIVALSLLPKQKVEHVVTLPPGRAMLRTNPDPTGSMACVNTIGVLRAACSIGAIAMLPDARMTSGASAASSAADFWMMVRSLPGQR
jgi:Family of unknown function (DUF5681)